MTTMVRFAVFCFAICSNLFLIGCGDGGGSSDSAGVSGSKAKLIAMNGDLFSLASGELIRIDMVDPASPSVTDRYYIGSDAQTLTTDGELLFVGGESSVSNYRYSQALGFEFISSQQRRVRGRDPVITDGDYAYSTFITQDWGTEDAPDGIADLYVYEILENSALQEIGIYPDLGYLHGLTLWNKNLLVCDYYDGILHFDVTDPNRVELLNTLSYAPCEDILHLGNGHIVTVGKQGIFQLMPIEENKLALISLYK